MTKQITKIDSDNFTIEETKQQSVKTTINLNIPQLKRQIERLKTDIAELTDNLTEKESLLKEIQKAK